LAANFAVFLKWAEGEAKITRSASASALSISEVNSTSEGILTSGKYTLFSPSALTLAGRSFSKHHIFTLCPIL
jgi:hypothetical protein